MFVIVNNPCLTVPPGQTQHLGPIVMQRVPLLDLAVAVTLDDHAAVEDQMEWITQRLLAHLARPLGKDDEPGMMRHVVILGRGYEQVVVVARGQKDDE